MKTRWLVPIAGDRHIEILISTEKEVDRVSDLRMMMSHYKEETFTIEEADEFYRTFGDALEAAKQLRERREQGIIVDQVDEPANTVEWTGRTDRRLSDLGPEKLEEMDRTSRRLYEGLTTDGHETIEETEDS